MEKKREFRNVFFDTSILKNGLDNFNNVSKYENKYDSQYLSIWFKNEEWLHDNLDEFFSDYRKEFILSTITISYKEYKIGITTDHHHNYTSVSAAAPTRQEIENILESFENSWKDCYVENIIVENQPTIFIGHGRDQQWKDLKDHLHDKHKYKIESYETGERAGHTIRDVLEKMLDNSTFAILVMTGEDKVAEQSRARQNVIHEVGLFQGRLGFNKAIVLLEEDTEEFSNIHGINQIRFKRNRIKETFGDVLAVLKREFNNE
ncbi:MAG TPA: nucleotide-binding protein [Williamwhitmania sp.]|nr:nucleotide-binding protein [Williamwhitmania sp.]